MTVQYLDMSRITRAKQGDAPRYGMTALGYTKRSGAPSSVMIQIDGEKRWRRVMIWCFSNSGTLFVRVKGQPLVLSNEYELRDLIECSACLEHGTGACQGDCCGSRIGR
jgi:hypothetical protein